MSILLLSAAARGRGRLGGNTSVVLAGYRTNPNLRSQKNRTISRLLPSEADKPAFRAACIESGGECGRDGLLVSFIGRLAPAAKKRSRNLGRTLCGCKTRAGNSAALQFQKRNEEYVTIQLPLDKKLTRRTLMPIDKKLTHLADTRAQIGSPTK